MRDATVGALTSVPALALPAAAKAAPVDLILTAIERDHIAYVAFVASVNPTDEVKAAQEGRVTQADEDADEAASEVEEDAVTELRVSADELIPTAKQVGPIGHGASAH
jgi:hypothetical protein